MPEHFNEPWHLHDMSGPTGAYIEYAPNERGVGKTVNIKDFDTARRIVACVNACAGIPTEALEGATGADAARLLALEIAAGVAGERVAAKLRGEG